MILIRIIAKRCVKIEVNNKIRMQQNNKVDKSRSLRLQTLGLTISNSNGCRQTCDDKKSDTQNTRLACQVHQSTNHRSCELECDHWVISHISVGRVRIPHCLVVDTNTNKKQWSENQPKWQMIHPTTMISYSDNRKVHILVNSMSRNVLDAKDVWRQENFFPFPPIKQSIAYCYIFINIKTVCI